MFSAFRIGPAASGHGLCDIDRVLFRVTKSRVKNWQVLVRRKYTDNFGFPILVITGIFSSCKDFPVF